MRRLRSGQAHTILTVFTFTNAVEAPGPGFFESVSWLNATVRFSQISKTVDVYAITLE